MNKPTMSSAKFSFYQDGNTLGTTEETECLELSFETQACDAREGNFITIKTETGWSISYVDELIELINSVNPERKTK